jgi:hypothetical protein
MVTGDRWRDGGGMTSCDPTLLAGPVANGLLLAMRRTDVTA